MARPCCLLMVLSCLGVVLVTLSQVTYMFVGVSMHTVSVSRPHYQVSYGTDDVVHQDLSRAGGHHSPWYKTGFLDRNISRSNLKDMDVRYYQGMHCDAPLCPTFQQCNSKDSALHISACSNPVLLSPKCAKGLPPLNYANNSFMDTHPRDRYKGQVFVLEGVYLNSRGHAFDEVFAYKHMNFCRGPTDFNYTAGVTPVTHFPELVSLAYWHGRNFFHTLVDMLPTMLLVEGLLANLSDIPVALRVGQSPFLEKLEIFGLRLREQNLRPMRDDELFYTDRLILPAGPHCGRPQKPVWDFIREERVLLPEARRKNSRPWGEFSASRSAGNGAIVSATSASVAPSSGAVEWWVVLGDRAGRTRHLSAADELRKSLEATFPGRVVMFNGSLGLEETRRLFSRVRLFVSPHGALMTNMIFMRDDASVLEIRPRGYNIGCYHHLADVCSLNYYLVYGNGTKDTALNMSAHDVLQVVRRMPWLSGTTLSDR